MVYIMFIEKSKTNVYVTVLLFILVSIWVHVESPKYKMVCIKSPKSSEFAKWINTQCSKILYYVDIIVANNCPIDCFIDREIKQPGCWGYETPAQ